MRSAVHRGFGTLIIVSCLPWIGLAQQSATYGEEYALYQQIEAETAPAKRKELVLQFVRQFQKSELDPHVSYIYAQYLGQYQQRGEWERLGSEAEVFLRSRPGDANVAAMATDAYQKLGQPDKLVRFGTQLYSQAPSGATAYLLAKAYQSMNDTANFKRWAERTVQHAPNNVEMLLELVNASWREGDLAASAGWAEKALAQLRNVPADPQTNLARAFAHRAVGQNAYQQNDFSTAQDHFRRSVELDPKTDFGHLQLGYCNWRLGRADDAIRCFARAVALNGNSAREARRELYNLLRARYGNTDNAARLIEDAKRELGV